MHPEHLPLLFVYVGGALTISFICSILEAVLLSSRMTELMERRARGDKGAELLMELKDARIDDAISSILTLNTIAHTIGASLAGAQAAMVWGDAAVGIFSGVLTLLVLVVTEIIPKTLGTVHASRLTGVVARTIHLLTKLLFLPLFFTRFLTRLMSGSGHGHSVSQREVAALVAVAREQGNLSGDMGDALSNMLRFDEILVADVMTPRTVVWMMRSTATLDELLEAPQEQTYSRVPVFEETRDHVIGYVLVREAVRALAKGADGGQPLRQFLRETQHVEEKMPLGELLRRLIEWHAPMAMVVDEFGGVSGLVTLEDALETILGQEILDELDRHADLRKVAMQLRDRRLARVSTEGTNTDEGKPAAPEPMPTEADAVEPKSRDEK